MNEETSKDYTLREFLVTKADEKEERRIFHFHFLGWPDHGTPEDPGCVLNFLHDVNLKQESLDKAGKKKMLLVLKYSKISLLFFSWEPAL